MGVGHFGICLPSRRTGYTWRVERLYHCRDRFMERWHKRHVYILFQHKIGERRKIASFFNELEKRLKLRTFSQFGPTQRAGISWIKVSSFWREEIARRSFLSAMLRAARNYHPDKKDFIRTVFSVPYTHSNGTVLRSATERFLAGYTSFKGRHGFSGWQDAFTTMGDYRYLPVAGYTWVPRVNDIEKMLVKPRKRKKAA